MELRFSIALLSYLHQQGKAGIAATDNYRDLFPKLAYLSGKKRPDACRLLFIPLP